MASLISLARTGDNSADVTVGRRGDKKFSLKRDDSRVRIHFNRPLWRWLERYFF